MEIYKAKILLGSKYDHQVWKENLTAAEIKLLEHIHAGENPCVVDIEKTGSVNRSDRKERARLLSVYGEWKMGRGASLIKELFGVEGVPLPQVYEAPVPMEVAAVEVDEDDGEEEVYVPTEPIVRTKPIAARDEKGRIVSTNKETSAAALAG
jgi:hypothetical protein